LFVARPAGVKPTAGISDAGDQFALDERMDVLVVRAGLTTYGQDGGVEDPMLEFLRAQQEGKHGRGRERLRKSS